MSRIVIGKLGKEEPTSTTDYEPHPADVGAALEALEMIGDIQYETIDNYIRINEMNMYVLIKQTLLAQSRELAEIKGKLKEYESIHIGIDVGFKDLTGISIMQIEKEQIYILYGKALAQGSEEHITLIDLIKLKRQDNFVELKPKELSSDE